MLEALTILIVTTLFFAILSLTVDFRIIVDHAAFAAGLAATLLLAAGFGVFNAVVSTMIPTYGRIWGIIRLPLFILSGIFYVPNSLPDAARDVLWWNPVAPLRGMGAHGHLPDVRPAARSGGTCSPWGWVSWARASRSSASTAFRLLSS